MSVRLFVGLPLPADAVAALDAVVAPIRLVREDLAWTRPDGWHLTLAFIGQVPETDTEAVVDAVWAGCAGRSPIVLELVEAGRFGTGVLWVGAADEPAGSVADLGKAVQAALAGAGLPVEVRDVHAHVTIARGRRGRRGNRRGTRVTDAEVAALQVPAVKWTADAAVVFSSERGGRGPAHYAAVASVPLAGPL